jgi:nicotinamide-nucleotide amidase
MKQVSVISTGTELMNGSTVDTNSSFISGLFYASNFHVRRHISVGDRRDDILNACNACLGDSDCVIMSGGLGPTDDDLTVDIISEICGTGKVHDEASMDRMKTVFESFGRPVSESDRKMIEVPEGAFLFRNKRGLSPGFARETPGGALIIALPGVPHEMEFMMTDSVFAFLAGRYGFEKRDSVSFRVIGLGESDINDAVRTMKSIGPGIEWGITAGMGMMTVTCVAAEGHSLDAGELRSEAEGIFGISMLGREFSTSVQEMVSLLEAKGLTIATAESCTGGLLAKLITDVPGASRIFMGSVVAYSNEIKTGVLDVPEQILIRNGAVSEETARIMAENIRLLFKTDLAVSVSGIAGPEGGTAKKPLGTVCLAFAFPDGVEVMTRLYTGSRDIIRNRAANFAIDHVRRYLKK